jgi:hypothetical protein
MQEKNDMQSLSEIRKMMEKSSRFISLSGLSGIGAGTSALLGAGASVLLINKLKQEQDYIYTPTETIAQYLLMIAIATFILAFGLAFLFTYKKSKKDEVALWGVGTRNLLWYTLVPMVVGAIVCYRFFIGSLFHFIAPSLLIFYGLGLVNGSKYTLGEVRYLGYVNIILGLINLFFPSLSLLFWTLGFGIAHIVYGIIMWMRYERN